MVEPRSDEEPKPPTLSYRSPSPNRPAAFLSGNSIGFGILATLLAGLGLLALPVWLGLQPSGDVTVLSPGADHLRARPRNPPPGMGLSHRLRRVRHLHLGLDRDAGVLRRVRVNLRWAGLDGSFHSPPADPARG